MENIPLFFRKCIFICGYCLQQFSSNKINPYFYNKLLPLYILLLTDYISINTNVQITNCPKFEYWCPRYLTFTCIWKNTAFSNPISFPISILISLKPRRCAYQINIILHIAIIVKILPYLIQLGECVKKTFPYMCKKRNEK